MFLWIVKLEFHVHWGLPKVNDSTKNYWAPVLYLGLFEALRVRNVNKLQTDLVKEKSTWKVVYRITHISVRTNYCVRRLDTLFLCSWKSPGEDYKLSWFERMSRRKNIPMRKDSMVINSNARNSTEVMEISIWCYWDIKCERRC